MTRRSRTLLLLLAAGCSSLNSDANGVVAIEVTSPATAVMEDRDTINLVTTTLSARALNLNGDSVDVRIVWTSADTSARIIDSIVPLIAGNGTFGAPRIQAREGSLGSPVVAYQLRSRSDTLALSGSDSIVVPSGIDESDSLQVALLTYNPAGPLAGRRMIFTIVSPVFADPADRTVEFTDGGGLADTVTTGTNGQPQTRVTLTRRTGKTAPDSAKVTLTVTRPSGRTVPGLARPFTVYFQ